MTKQNFISMSLESGLKYVDLLCDPDNNICTLKEIINGFYCDEYGNIDCEINDCMPILRPLSDLTKEIDGAPAFFRYYENDSPIKKQLVNLAYGIGDVDDFPFHVVLRMIKEHFDIYNLISKNQAIDINTLERNPYK